MKTKELFFYMKQATENGATNALLATVAAPKSMNKAQAYRLYGRCNFDRWILEGILRSISIQTS